MKCFFIAFFTLIFSLSFFALEKENMILVEHYHHKSLGSIGMFGHSFNTFITHYTYYSITLFEAVYGQNRSGYAVANLGLGQRLPMDFALLDVAFYVGAGGGGHLSQHVAGGLSLKLQTGIFFHPVFYFSPVLYLGYITYPYGDLNALFLSAGFQYNFTIATEPPMSESSKFVSSWEMAYKSYIYDQTTNETIELLGGERRKYFFDDWYYGESGFAAISSGRFGYIEVGALIGRQFSLYPFVFNFNLNLGAGGGGGSDIKEGSGLLFQSALQFGIPLSEQFQFNYDFRYVNFISGQINSLSTGFSVRYIFEQF